MLQPVTCSSQQMKRSARLWHQASLVAICVLLLTGCAAVEKYSLTYRLWDTDELRKWNEPEPDPHLALFETTNHADLLVQYDAFSEKRSAVKRRGYYLQPNQERILARKPPRWASPSAVGGLKPIPVFSAQWAATNPPPEAAVYAVTRGNGRAFTVSRPGESRQTFELPVFVEGSGNALRVAGTPFAVAGDTVMVGVVAAVVGFVAWVHIGAPMYSP